MSRHDAGGTASRDQGLAGQPWVADLEPGSLAPPPQPGVMRLDRLADIRFGRAPGMAHRDRRHPTAPRSPGPGLANGEVGVGAVHAGFSASVPPTTAETDFV
jgi:hypothetical protein